jgi:ABC-type amino acid transport substrate-binding protein
VSATAQPQLPPGIEPQGKLLEILQRGSVNIWLNAGFIPYETMDPATSQFEGVDIDIARKLFEEGLGVRIEFTDSAFQGLVPALATRKADFVISAMGATEQRAESVDFSIPYSPAGTVILVRGDNTDINSLEDLNGKTIGAETGSTPLRRAEVVNQDLQAQGMPGFAELRSYVSAPTIWEDVRVGRLHAAPVGFSNAVMLMKERPGEFRICCKIGGESYYAMVVPKGEQALLDYVNYKIREWRADWTLWYIHQKWFGDVADILDVVPYMPDEVFFSR